MNRSCSQFSSSGPTTPPPEGPPGTPLNLTTRAVTDNSVTLTWNGPGDAVYYTIRYERPDTGEVFNDYSYSSEWTANNLEPDALYTFEVSSVNRYAASYPTKKLAVQTASGTSG